MFWSPLRDCPSITAQPFLARLGRLAHDPAVTTKMAEIDSFWIYSVADTMPDPDALAKYYETLNDSQLLNLKSEGGFTEEAERLLADELRRRNLDAGDLKRYEAQGERIKLREETTEKGSRGRGPGLLFFGKHYLNEEDRKANIQVRTKWFALGGMPIVPIASYRFHCSGDAPKWSSRDAKQRVIDRVPLNWTQVFVTWFKMAVVLVVVTVLAAGFILYKNHGRF